MKRSIVLIILLVALFGIPGALFVKKIVALRIHNHAVQSVYIKDGYKNQHTIEEAIEELDLAKILSRNNYLIYEEQIKMLCLVNDHQRAFEVCKELSKIKPDHANFMTSLVHGSLKKYLSLKSAEHTLLKEALLIEKSLIHLMVQGGDTIVQTFQTIGFPSKPLFLRGESSEQNINIPELSDQV